MLFIGMIRKVLREARPFLVEVTPPVNPRSTTSDFRSWERDVLQRRESTLAR